MQKSGFSHLGVLWRTEMEYFLQSTRCKQEISNNDTHPFFFGGKAMRTKVAFALFGFLMLTNFLHGQGLGSIVGTVTDPSGAAVPSAQIKITELGTGNSRMVSSDPQGYYVVTSLRPEQYTLSVQAAGFRTFTAKQVTLLADQNLTVNVKLDLGAANEIVEVTSNALQVN